MRRDDDERYGSRSGRRERRRSGGRNFERPYSGGEERDEDERKGWFYEDESREFGFHGESGAGSRYGREDDYEREERESGQRGYGMRFGPDEFDADIGYGEEGYGNQFGRQRPARSYGGRHGGRDFGGRRLSGMEQSGRSHMGQRGGGFRGKGPKGYQRSEERIREDVCERLSDHDEIDASEISVTVRNGEVTLEGLVHERRMKRLAEDVIEDVPGVADVNNHIRVMREGGTSGDTYSSDRSSDLEKDEKRRAS